MVITRQSGRRQNAETCVYGRALSHMRPLPPTEMLVTRRQSGDAARTSPRCPWILSPWVFSDPVRARRLGAVPPLAGCDCTAAPSWRPRNHGDRCDRHILRGKVRRQSGNRADAKQPFADHRASSCTYPCLWRASQQRADPKHDYRPPRAPAGRCRNRHPLLWCVP